MVLLTETWKKTVDNA